IGLRYEKADGNDYEDVVRKAKALVADIRGGKGPAVLECVAYRHMAHSAPVMDDALGYRGEDVLEKRLELDSLKKLRTAVLSSGVATEEDLTAAEEQLRDEVAADIQYAV